eukprot:TRINITY_DN4981_c0_g1_i1.p1 TRINITY_DN4981_c0_g1~~TRINITY_DN4981_c0_g1_i1.p1  ORF type:complete len:190 (-),score=38.67 TRINITY_DN4981_c0_g1_i1:335-871(-)
MGDPAFDKLTLDLFVDEFQHAASKSICTNCKGVAFDRVDLISSSTRSTTDSANADKPFLVASLCYTCSLMKKFSNPSHLRLRDSALKEFMKLADIRCPRHKEGCKAIGKVQNFLSLHEPFCKFRVFNCGCGENVVATEVFSHAETCPLQLALFSHVVNDQEGQTEAEEEQSNIKQDSR